uniref:Uncharacterized protein n=1 Tax=Romanomermis culicivorax TaxID=13658 RepID=A0A915KTR9_ROMCU
MISSPYKQKRAQFNPLMPIQKGNAQQSSLMQFDKIWRLQTEMARLMAHIAKLMALQQSLAPGNPMPSAQLWVQVQNVGNHLRGAHLQMCSFHGCCTHSDASCWAHPPNSTAPSKAATAKAGCCYFCGICLSGLGTGDFTCPTTATAEIWDASYFTSVPEAENNWRRQHCGDVLTERSSGCPGHCGGISGASCPFCWARTLTPGIQMDSALEVVGQLELMNQIDSSSITDTMPAIWSTDLAKKYPHLLWVLLNELFEVKALTAADIVLMALSVLGPEVARQALELISNGTIQATPVHKLLLEGEPSSPAVDAVCCAVEQASWIPQPVPSIATLLPMMRTSLESACFKLRSAVKQ